MSFLQAFILGLVQGLTEFLPVSSSAHLVFTQHLLGFKESLLFFDVVVHLGTLTALFIYFSTDIAHILRDSIYGMSYIFRRKPLNEIFEIAPHSRWAFGVLIACIPTGLMGFLFRDWFEQLFGSLHAVSTALLVNSVILWSTNYYQKGEKGIEKASWLDFLVIGTLQGVAIIPGISRSGTTIAAGLLLGLRREEAFRFSFLLAIPAILGAGVLELRHGLGTWEGQWVGLSTGFLVAAFFGYISIFVLSGIMKKGKLHVFGFYTLLLGLVILTSFLRLE